jgi:diguanylate cyclase (GGDEF)-like protein
VKHDLTAERLLAVIDTQNEITASVLDIDATIALVVRRAQELVGAAAGVVELVEHDELVSRVASGAASALVGLRLKSGASFSGMCVARGEILYCEDAAVDTRVDAESCSEIDAVSIVCVPLSDGGRIVGVLKVYDPRLRAFDEADLRTLDLLSRVIAAHMTRASGRQERQRASSHDALTGLRNRHGFGDRLATEAARVRRHGDDFTLCVLDLDGFRQVNDTLGHAAGDDVLRAFACHLAEVRGEDAAFRLSGDEFALMLVGAASEDAKAVAERIDAAAHEDPACRGVTLSWGIATLTDNDPVSMISRAEAALDDAKRTRAC